MKNKEIKDDLILIIRNTLENDKTSIDINTPLLSQNSNIDSMKLVEICLSLEDKASELGFEFDWTSSSAMSQSRSIFRTVGTLIDEFLNQKHQTK